jgi:oxaloacetate decarboxylase gamma subunit
MGDTSLLNEGFTLMIFGIGFVFVFLTLLVIATSFMSWFITRYEKSHDAIPPDGIPAPTAVLSPQQEHDRQSQLQQDDGTIVSILTAAVHKFRSKK